MNASLGEPSREHSGCCSTITLPAGGDSCVAPHGHEANSCSNHSMTSAPAPCHLEHQEGNSGPALVLLFPATHCLPLPSQQNNPPFWTVVMVIIRTGLTGEECVFLVLIPAPNRRQTPSNPGSRDVHMHFKGTCIVSSSL